MVKTSRIKISDLDLKIHRHKMIHSTNIIIYLLNASHNITFYFPEFLFLKSTFYYLMDRNRKTLLYTV